MSSRTLSTGHIGLNVTDLDRSITFYRTIFGLQVLRRAEAHGKPFAFLGEGPDLRVTLWQQSTGTFAPDRPGLHHLSFAAGSLEELREIEARLRTLGTPILSDGVVAHEEGASSAALFLADPDGTRLEVFAPISAGEINGPAQGAPACGFF